MNIIDISKEIVDSLFPNETWTEPYKNVFIALSRQPKSSEQKKVFSKEYDMAKLASDKGHIIFLLPEFPIKKNSDALFDAEFTEFKNVTGEENAISHRFREALHQGQNVYLKIDSTVTIRRIKQILSGVLKEKDNTGKVYCYVSRLDVFYSWNMQNLKQNKAPNGALSLPQAEINQNSDILNLTCKNADVNKNGDAE